MSGTSVFVIADRRYLSLLPLTTIITAHPNQGYISDVLPNSMTGLTTGDVIFSVPSLK